MSFKEYLKTIETFFGKDVVQSLKRIPRLYWAVYRAYLQKIKIEEKTYPISFDGGWEEDLNTVFINKGKFLTLGARLIVLAHELTHSRQKKVKATNKLTYVKINLHNEYEAFLESFKVCREAKENPGDYAYLYDRYCNYGIDGLRYSIYRKGQCVADFYKSYYEKDYEEIKR